jgi:hypothetical protein
LVSGGDDVKQALAFVAAFALGALLVYAILVPRQEHHEEWGVVVVHFGFGASLWGLFESRVDCLKARKEFIEEYGRITGAVNKDSRAVVIKSGDASVLVTFSCLPLSEIRGLPLGEGQPPKSN